MPPAAKKPVVLYPEGLYPDLSVEAPIFGPGVELRLRNVNHYSELPLSDREDVTGLMVFRFHVPKEDMDLFPNLKAIVRMGVGYDRRDRAHAAKRGILIMNLPDYGTTEVADHAMSLMLALRRGLVHQFEQGTKAPYNFGLIRSKTILRQGVQVS